MCCPAPPICCRTARAGAPSNDPRAPKQTLTAAEDRNAGAAGIAAGLGTSPKARPSSAPSSSPRARSARG